MDLRIVGSVALCQDSVQAVGERRWIDERRKAMRIEQVMTRFPKTCRPDCSLGQAAGLMWEHDVGCLPVTEGDGWGRLLGMITDRDICMTAHFSGRALNEIRVAEAMTKDVWACNAGDDVAEATAIMRETAVRRLPVIDESERVVGVLSLADLAREAVRWSWAMNCDLSAAQVGRTLAAICEPHRVAGRAEAAPPAGVLEPSLERQWEPR